MRPLNQLLCVADMVFIEHRVFQIVFRVAGIILLPIILLLSLYSTLFLYTAIVKPDLIALILGLSAPLGLLGYLAALYRVSKKRNSMSQPQVKYTRLGLMLGVVSSLMLLALVVHFDLGQVALLFFLSLCFGGTYFVRATPKIT